MKLFRSSVGKQISYVVVGDALTVLAITVAGMILARVISKADMGTYRQVTYLTAFAMNLVEFGLSASIYRFWNLLDEDRRTVFVKSLTLFAGIAGLVSLVGLAVVGEPLATAYHNPELALAILIAAAWPLAQIPLMFLRPVLISKGASFKATTLEAVFTTVPVFALIAPLFFGWSFLDALILWMVVSALRLVAVPMFLGTYYRRPGPWWDRSLVREVWDYIWPIQVSRLPGIFSRNIDQFVMSFLLPPHAFAIYAIGARELPLVGTIGPSVSSVLIPHMVEDYQRGDMRRICERWKNAVLRTSLLTYPIAAISVVFAGAIMSFLFSDAYEESRIPFQIFSLITLVRVIDYASIAKVIGKTTHIMKSAFLSSASIFVLAWPFVALWGIAGMATVVFLSYVIGALYYLVVYRRAFGMRLFSFFPLHIMVLLTVYSFACAFAGQWIGARILPPQPHHFLSLGLWLAVQVTIVTLLYSLIFIPRKTRTLLFQGA